MKKIMFSDKYGLTQAVLDGRKTMTRRFVPDGTPFGCWSETVKRSRYQVGEVVAIAQKYSDVAQGGYHVDSRYDAFRTANWGDGEDCALKSSAGWTNKMFVRAGFMPHHIRFTDIKAERLQDISDDDCLKEGIRKWTKDEELFKYDLADGFEIFEWRDKPTNPREAFTYLIDRISGKGTWELNTWVFAYEFELVD